MMRILIAIESSNNSKILERTTLLWAPRGGFDLRIFIPDESQLSEYMAAIDSVNYKEFLSLNYDMIIVGKPTEEYAKAEGYDLLVRLPDNLKTWNTTRYKDLMIYEYVKDISSTRGSLAEQTLNSGEVVTYPNGVTMKRL